MYDTQDCKPKDFVAVCYFGNTFVKKFEGTYDHVETEAKRWLSENVQEFANRFKLNPTTLTAKDHPYSYQLI